MSSAVATVALHSFYSLMVVMHPKKVGDRHLLNEQCYLIEKTDTDIEKCVSVCVFKICIELQHLTFPKISVSLTLLVVMQTV